VLTQNMSLHLKMLSQIVKIIELCDLLGYYAALSDSSVPTFRDNLSFPLSRVKKSEKKTSFLDFLTLEKGPICCSETSVQNYHSTLCNIPE
jgi:hypothetical protein